MKIFNLKYIKIVAKSRFKQILNVLPLLRYKQYTPFLILGHPRTGTTLLHTYLNSHLNILSLNEPLAYTNDGEALLHAYSRLIKVVGFKYFYEYILNDAKKASLIQLLTDYKIKVVHIHRHNYLRTFVSLKIAQKTNEWSSVDANGLEIKQKQLSLTKEECEVAFTNYLKIEKEVQELLQKFNVPVCWVNYEELVKNPVDVMFEVYQFLGVRPHVPISLLKRQNPESINDLIVNYEQLKNDFKGTEFQIFFEDN